MTTYKVPFHFVKISREGETKSHLCFNNYLATGVLLAVLGMCWCSSAFAGCEFEKLFAPDGAVSDYFGCSVDIWGDTAVIGAPYDDDNGSSSGSVYVFRFNGSSWVQEDKLLPSDGTEGDNFGQSVGIWDDAIIVGAVGDDDMGSNSGSAYFFWFNGSSWVQRGKVVAPDGAVSNYFGQSVGIWADKAVVGAYYDDDNGNASGSAHVFRFTDPNWVWEAKLLASDGNAGNYFGYSIGINGDAIVVGAHGDDDSGIASGSAYIFRFNDPSWVQETKLLASDGNDGDYFGYSVGISGDTAIIGAYLDDDNSIDSGSAYIFKLNGSSWEEQAKLLPSDGNEDSDYFGYSVGISGDTAVVGATGDDDKGDSSGSAYTFWFNGSTWTRQEKLLACDGMDYDLLGTSAAIWDDAVVIGAQFGDGNDVGSGSAYIFDLSINPCDINLDSAVDLKDYSTLAAHWMERACGPYGCDRTDLTGDGRVDSRDLRLMCNNWLAGI